MELALLQLIFLSLVHPTLMLTVLWIALLTTAVWAVKRHGVEIWLDPWYALSP